MIARMVEIRTKPGKAEELCHKVHQRVLTILEAQPGFIDEIVLVSETEADKVVALSFWKTKEDAASYSVELYAQIRELIEHQAHASPKVHTFNVETSTAHKIARGRAAWPATLKRLPLPILRWSPAFVSSQSCLPVPSETHLSSRRKEGLQYRGAVRGQDAGGDLDAVIELRVVQQAEARAHRAAFRVVGTVHEPLDPRLQDCSGAHCAGLNRDVEGCRTQAMVAESLGRCAQRNDLGVRRWVAVGNRAVPAAGHHLSFGHDHCAHGHFSGTPGPPGLLERQLHVLRVFCVPVHEFQNSMTLRGRAPA